MVEGELQSVLADRYTIERELGRAAGFVWGDSGLRE